VREWTLAKAAMVLCRKGKWLMTDTASSMGNNNRTAPVQAASQTLTEGRGILPSVKNVITHGERGDRSARW